MRCYTRGYGRMTPILSRLLAKGRAASCSYSSIAGNSVSYGGARAIVPSPSCSSASNPRHLQILQIRTTQRRRLSHGWFWWGWNTSGGSQAAAASSIETKAPFRTVLGEPLDFPAGVSWETIGQLPPPPAIPTPEELVALSAKSLSDMGLFSWNPSGFVQTLLDGLHSTGLPWWAAIAVSCVILRTLLGYFTVLQQKNAEINRRLGPDIASRYDRVRKLRQMNRPNDMLEAHQLLREIQDLYKTNGYSHWSVVVPPVINGCVLITYFFALSGMARAPMPGFDCEGLWWFSDLTKSDPLYLLPIYGTLVLAVLMSKGIESASSEMSLSTGNRIILAVIFAGSFALFSSFQPSAVAFYWCVSTTFSAGQYVLFQRAWFRRMVGLTPWEQLPKLGAKSTPTDLLDMASSRADAMRDVRRRDRQMFESGAGAVIKR